MRKITIRKVKCDKHSEALDVPHYFFYVEKGKCQMTVYFDVTEKTMSNLLNNGRYRDNKIPVIIGPSKVELIMPPATGKNKDIVRAKVLFELPKDALNMDKSNRLFSMGLTGLMFLPEETVVDKMKVNTKRLKEQPQEEKGTMFLVYAADEWKTKSSLELMFIATDKQELAKGIASLSKELTGDERDEDSLKLLIDQGGVHHLNEINGIYVEKAPVNKVLG